MISQQAQQLKLEQQNRKSRRSAKIRNFFQSIFSHAAINFVGLFFLIPFLWMILTAFNTGI